VLRGPQSILFGKNSIAGALNITTARPTDELEAGVKVLFEPEFGEQKYSGYLSGPFTDSFRGRISARYRELDGYLRNLTLAEDEPNREETNVRGWLEWDVTGDLRLSLKAERGEFDVEGRQIEIYDEIPVPGAPGPTNPFGGLTYSQILFALGQDAGVLNNFPDYKRSANGDFSNNETEEYVFTIDWAIGEHELTAITGYSKYEFQELCDCDFTGDNVFGVGMAEEFD
jgi:outer membrane receptor protein involved in Fe transport